MGEVSEARGSEILPRYGKHLRRFCIDVLNLRRRRRIVRPGLGGAVF